VVAHSAPAALSRAGGDETALPRALLVGALIALFVRAFVVAAALIPTASMAPTLLAGDRVLVDRMLFSRPWPPGLESLLPVRPPRRGDVVWFRSPIDPRTALVKRVVALAGDPFAGRRVAPEHLAVLGDGRSASLDSRRFGPVPRSALAGRVVLVLWSADRHRWRTDRVLVPVR